MNPSFKFLLALIISIELSLKTSLTTNLLVIVFAVVYLLTQKIKFKSLLFTLLTPLIAAFTIFATLYWFAPQPNNLLRIDQNNCRRISPFTRTEFSFTK